MLNITLIDIEPVTLNHYQKTRVIKQRGRYLPVKYKPAASVTFDLAVDKQLEQYHLAFKAFNSYYNSKEHYLIATYRFFYPILTKQKTISRRSKDIDNCIKPLQDLLFRYLKADDAEIIEVTASKVHSEKPKIVIDLIIRDISLIK